MDKKSTVYIGCSIVLGCLIIGLFINLAYNDKGNEQAASISQHLDYLNKDIFTLSEVAHYLQVTEEDIKKIIVIEQSKLEKLGNYNGDMFPYYKIDDKYYFSKKMIDEWVYQISRERRHYDTKKYKITSGILH